MRISYKKGIYFFEDRNLLLGFTDRSFQGLDVEEDIKKIASLLKIEFKKITFLHQLHSPKVVLATKRGRVYQGDSLLTKERLRFLVIRTADCIPLFFYDYKSRVIGLIHLGWRPAYKRIIDNFLRVVGSFNLDYANSYLLVGPGLRRCCFEVKKDFAGFEFFKRFIYKRKEKFFLDLVGFAKENFLKGNFKKTNILDTQLCSRCFLSFFSFRRENTEKRTLSFIIQR